METEGGTEAPPGQAAPPAAPATVSARFRTAAARYEEKKGSKYDVYFSPRGFDIRLIELNPAVDKALREGKERADPRRTIQPTQATDRRRCQGTAWSPAKTDQIFSAVHTRTLPLNHLSAHTHTPKHRVFIKGGATPSDEVVLCTDTQARSGKVEGGSAPHLIQLALERQSADPPAPLFPWDR